MAYADLLYLCLTQVTLGCQELSIATVGRSARHGFAFREGFKTFTIPRT